MIIKWGFIFTGLVALFLMFNMGIGYFFSNFGDSIVYCLVIGFPLGIFVRKWLFRTFWM
jgi:hypothetical protein